MKKFIFSILFALGFMAAAEAQTYVKVLVYNDNSTPGWIFKTADSTPSTAYNGTVPNGMPAINVAFQPYVFPVFWKAVAPNGADTGTISFSGAVGVNTIPLGGGFSLTWEVQNIGGGNYHFIVHLL